MTGIAIFFLLLSAFIIWGGLIASAIALRKHAEVAEYPPGGENDEADSLHG